MDPLTAGLMIAMFGGGMYSSHQQKKAAEEQMREQKKVASANAAYSPWTGFSSNMQVQQKPDSFAPIMQGATSAMLQYQAGQEAADRKETLGRQESRDQRWQDMYAKQHGLDQRAPIVPQDSNLQLQRPNSSWDELQRQRMQQQQQQQQLQLQKPNVYMGYR